MSEGYKPPFEIEDLDSSPVVLPSAPTIALSAGDTQQLLKNFADVTSLKFKLEEDLAREKAKNSTRAVLDELIKPFATKVFSFMCFYSAVVALLLFCSGFDPNFKLPETVLSYLVGSTAVTVLGLVGTVLTGIFVGARK